MIKFHEVIEPMQKVEGETSLPRRATKGSGAYDFYAKTNYTVKPNEIVKIWTDVKAEMDKDVILLINVRSSMGGKWELANTQGWIDADYSINNTKNDGNIGIFLRNTSDEIQTINKGDRIAQGMFTHYLITVDDKPLSEERNGGFGSTGR
jgi:dUTP pyrophosphatase